MAILWPLTTISKVAPTPVMDVVEKAAAYIPPFVYSHVTGITSPTGAEAEGWLISLGITADEMRTRSSEQLMKQLHEAGNAG